MSAPDAGGPGARRGDWRWSLVFVGALHLLTTSGMWQVTDHGEMLAMARELLHHGTLSPGPPAAPALRQTHRRSRFVPATSLTLLPLLATDELLGWGDPDQFGHLVHLQGHVFVLLTLALLGHAVASSGSSPAAAAAAVLFTGCAWPVWMVSLRLGPEPILLLVTLVFAVSDPDLGKGGVWARGIVCAVLPWCHATGPVMSVALISGVGIERRLTGAEGLGRTLRSLAPLLAGAALGAASLFVVWNYLYNGSFWFGGYAEFNAAERILGARPFHQGLLIYLRAVALEASPLLGLAVLGAWRQGRGGLRWLVLPVCVTATLILLFASFYQLEPERRLAVAYPLWGLAVGRTWDRIGLDRSRALFLMGGAALMGFAGYLGTPSFFYRTPWGLVVLPASLWALQAIEGRWAVAGAAVALLLAAAALAAVRLGRLFPDAPADDRTAEARRE